MPDFLHLERLPDSQLKMHCEGTPQSWVELILTGMNKSDDVAISMIAAVKFYLEKKGQNFYAVMKEVDKRVAEMEKKKK